jgi:hypothetical protein
LVGVDSREFETVDSDVEVTLSAVELERFCVGVDEGEYMKEELPPNGLFSKVGVCGDGGVDGVTGISAADKEESAPLAAFDDCNRR